MSSMMRSRAVIVALALAVVSAAGPGRAASGADPDATRIAYKAVDVFPIRFGGFLRVVAGNVLLVPATILSTLSLPFTRNLDSYRDNYVMLVQEPFDYTFRRRLGEDF
jgi:hypothetical protein